MITIILAIISTGFDYFSSHGISFIAMFTIANFFFNFGPAPTRFRLTGHGLSAAAGKLGAIIGVQVVAPHFAATVMGVFAIVMLWPRF